MWCREYRYAFLVVTLMLTLGCGQKPRSDRESNSIQEPLAESAPLADQQPLSSHEPLPTWWVPPAKNATAKRFVYYRDDVNSNDPPQAIGLIACIETGDQETYMQLLEKGADPNLFVSSGRSTMHLAAAQEEVFWLREALKHGGNPNLRSKGTFSPNSTPILFAIDARRVDNAVKLMNSGADIDQIEGLKTTPLCESAYMGLFGLMIKLIEAGANPLPPEPIGSIFDGGRFSETADEVYLEKTDLFPGIPGCKKEDFLALQALLIKKGYGEALPPADYKSLGRGASLGERNEWLQRRNAFLEKRDEFLKQLRAKRYEKQDKSTD